MVSRGARRGLEGGDAGRVGVVVGLGSGGAPGLGMCSGLVVEDDRGDGAAHDGS